MCYLRIYDLTEKVPNVKSSVENKNPAKDNYKKNKIIECITNKTKGFVGF